MKLFKKWFSSFTKEKVNKEICNNNIFYMEKFDNFRNQMLSIHLHNSDLIFQTFWSNFVHISLMNKEKNFKNDIKEEFDFTDYTDNSYIVFQKDDHFFDYKNQDEFDLQGIKIIKTTEELDKKIVIKSPNISKANLVLISRIPQEFNIDVKTNRNITIINSEDSKLIAEKEVKIEFTDDSILEKRVHNLEGKRIRTEYFSLKGNDMFINIKSYLETNKLNIISLQNSIIRIKKFTLVNEGVLQLGNSDINIRSIYAPVIENKYLEINISSGKVDFGNIQGNIKINTSDFTDINIENIECENFFLNSVNLSNSNRCELFINKIRKKCQINFHKNLVIYINKDKKENYYICNKEGSVLFGNFEEKEKENLNKIEVNCEDLEIVEISHWDYLKQKIEKKLKKKINSL